MNNISTESSLKECEEELRSLEAIIATNPLGNLSRYLTLYSLIKAHSTLELSIKTILIDFMSNKAPNQTMNFLDALHISSSGLTAQRLRMNLISGNLANVNTTRTKQGGPYKRKDAVFAAHTERQSFANMLKSQMAGKSFEVKVVGIVDDPRSPQLKYDPQHPHADKNGYVAMPDINVIEEMVNMMSATRSYEANVTAVKATKDMALKALEIGR